MEISRKHLRMLKVAVDRHVSRLKYPRRQSDLEGSAPLAEYIELQQMLEQLMLKE